MENVLIGDELLSYLFEQRYETCLQCPFMKASLCTLCGCVALAKSHSPLENCPHPDQKWLPRHYVDNVDEYVLKSELPENLQEYFDNEEIDMKDWMEFLEKGVKIE